MADPIHDAAQALLVFRSDPSVHPVGAKSGQPSYYHWPRDDDSGLALCSSNTALDETTGLQPGETAREARCRRTACAGAWSSYEFGTVSPDALTVDDVGRFWEKVDKDPGCWLWTATGHPDGYGGFRVRTQMRRAHRVAYELLVGPIPEGLQLDHLCKNRRCVNPAHLEPVTREENLRRGDRMNGNTAKTHCLHGHEFTEQNTRLRRRANGLFARECRTCALARRQAAKEASDGQS